MVDSIMGLEVKSFFIIVIKDEHQFYIHLNIFITMSLFYIKH